MHAAWNQPSDEEKWPEAAHDITAEGHIASCRTRIGTACHAGAMASSGLNCWRRRLPTAIERATSLSAVLPAPCERSHKRFVVLSPQLSRADPLPRAGVGAVDGLCGNGAVGKGRRLGVGEEEEEGRVQAQPCPAARECGEVKRTALRPTAPLPLPAGPRRCKLRLQSQ